MTPAELEALAKTVDLLGKVIGTIGFPIVVSLYLLLGLPKNLDRLKEGWTDDKREIITAVHGLRSDLQELLGLVRFERRLRDYSSQPDEHLRRVVDAYQSSPLHTPEVNMDDKNRPKGRGK